MSAERGNRAARWPRGARAAVPLLLAGLIAAAAGPASAAVLPPAWKQVTPAKHPPAGYSVSAFDPATGQLVLYGTDGSGGTAWTWTWSGGAWAQRLPHHMPDPRAGASMAFDPVSGRLLLFGGRYPLALSGYSDTWAWNGNDWTQLSPAHAPPARFGASIAFDPRIGRMILFGGDAGPLGDGELSDTWAWNGSDWSQLSPFEAPTLPEGTVAPLTYDPATSQMVLFGSGQTWLWTGSTWAPVLTAHTPSCPSGGATAFDPAVAGIVLVCGDTWTWTGSDWAEATGTVPSSRTGAAADFDRATGQLVVFGGDGGLTDTWVLNRRWSPVWTKAKNVSSPPARTDPAMVYDEATHELLLFGGATPDRLDDTWAWSGTGWTRARTGHHPTRAIGGGDGLRPRHRRPRDVRRRRRLRTPRRHVAVERRELVRRDPGRLASGQGGRVDDLRSVERPHRAVRRHRRWHAAERHLDLGRSGLVTRVTAVVADAARRRSRRLRPADGPAGAVRRRRRLRRPLRYVGMEPIHMDQLAPAHTPAARSGAAAAFDQVVGRAVLFGGVDGTGPRSPIRGDGPAPIGRTCRRGDRHRRGPGPARRLIRALETLSCSADRDRRRFSRTPGSGPRRTAQSGRHDEHDDHGDGL